MRIRVMGRGVNPAKQAGYARSRACARRLNRLANYPLPPEFIRARYSGTTATASTSIRNCSRTKRFTSTAVLAGGFAVFMNLSRTSRIAETCVIRAIRNSRRGVRNGAKNHEIFGGKFLAESGTVENTRDKFPV
jgi:hypothetical protein